MAIDSNVLQEVVDALKQDPEIKNNVYQATVSRIDGEGVVWVNIAGSDTETPTAITSAEVAPGDAVNVEWRNNKLYIGGNYSNPSAGVVRVEAVEAATQVASEAAANAVQEATRARDAADRAEGEAVRAGEAADRAKGKADDAADAAGNAQTSADSALVSLSTVEDVVGVLNWITEHGTMTLTSDVTVNPAHVYFIVDPAGDYDVGGTHYSIVSEPNDDDIGTYYELTVDESVQNYVATHVAVDTEGLWLIPDSGGNKILIATGAGSSYTTAGTYIIGKVNGIDTVFAKFTEKGLDVTTKNGTQVAQLGYDYTYGPGGSPTESPFFTLGTRKSGSTIGYYSIAEGWNNTASGPYSHAEGNNSVASGSYSHAEGGSYVTNNTASDSSAHAEGAGTTASGYGAHAEGLFAFDTDGMTPINTVASGDGSHAQNYGTIAASDYQTALGKLNVADNSDTYAVIVGNGTANDARRNALTIDWNGGVDTKGDVNIASGKHYKVNGTNLAASDVGALPISGGTVTGSLTIDNHSSAIGTVKQAYAAAKSVASGTNTNLTSISLEAGTWVVTGGVRFPNNATGYRRMNISTSNASGWADVQLPALSGASTQLAYTVVVSTTSTKTYYLNCYHNAGSALSLVAGGSENGINFLRAVRIA